MGESLQTAFPSIAQEWDRALNSVSPSDVKAFSHAKAWWVCEREHSWEASIASRASGRGCPFCANRRVLVGFNDLATTHPTLLQEWHPSKNLPLTPSNVIATTSSRMWWVCRLGHAYLCSGDKKVVGSGCPICNGKQIRHGFNDLASKAPELLQSWHPTKNLPLLPTELAAKSNRKVWWICARGHEWQISPNGKRGCPVCSNFKLEKGQNDMATTNPELAAEWNYVRNAPLLPSELVAGTRKSIWWLCSRGHEWRASGSNRLFFASSCPICSNKQVLQGFNDLAHTSPDLAKEWHPHLNGDLTASDVVATTHKKVWWRCEMGHEWRTSGFHRQAGTACPSCAPYGFKPDSPAVFYFLESPMHLARKVGVTNVEPRDVRLSGFRSRGWREVLVVQFASGSEALAIERKVLLWLRHDVGMAPYLSKVVSGSHGGWTETFGLEGVTNEDVIEKVKSLLSPSGPGEVVPFIVFPAPR
jgi:hypothetical protein